MQQKKRNFGRHYCLFLYIFGNRKKRGGHFRYTVGNPTRIEYYVSGGTHIIIIAHAVKRSRPRWCFSTRFIHEIRLLECVYWYEDLCLLLLRTASRMVRRNDRRRRRASLMDLRLSGLTHSEWTQPIPSCWQKSPWAQGQTLEYTFRRGGTPIAKMGRIRQDSPAWRSACISELFKWEYFM